MVNFFHPFLTRISIVLFLCILAGCQSTPEKEPDFYKQYKFDPKVIEKLPAYDSLVAAILEKFSFFEKHINENESYHAYKYMPLSDQPDVFKKLPPEIALRIDPCFNKLGKDFILGFDVFKDSTIKMYIRADASEKFHVDIEENLSYYPVSGHMRKRELPVLDTILNAHWQYWFRFNKRRFF